VRPFGAHTERVPGRCPRIVSLAAALGALGGCLAPEPVRETEWPPADFFFEVRHSVREADRVVERRWVQFQADGVVFFREASGWLDDPGSLPWPIFGRVCRYRMAPESTRQLARLLARAGLFELASPQSEEVAAPDLVTYRWRAFGSNERRLVLRGKLYGPAMRVLRVTNAFLPLQHEIALAEMTGETEERHLLAVPAPVESLADALGHHEAMLERAPEDQELLAHAIVLAIAAGRDARARALIGRLEQLEAAAERLRDVFPGEGGEAVAPRLRALLERR
jgi:hypothetical protein